MTCPNCQRPLHGLGTYCTRCQDYVDNLPASTTDTTPEAREAVPDDRSEKQIQMAIRKALKLHQFQIYDLSQDRPTRQTAGLADLYVVGHGTCAWIEVKTPKGKQSDAQKLFGRLVSEAGGLYFVWRHESEAIRWAEAVRQGRAA